MKGYYNKPEETASAQRTGGSIRGISAGRMMTAFSI